MQSVKNLLFVFLGIFGLTTCNQNTEKQDGGGLGSPLSVDKEMFSLYKMTDSIVYVARALSSDSSKFDLHLYEICISTPEGAKQTFTSVQQLTKQELDTKKTELQSSYNWSPFEGHEILFVQIQPEGFRDGMQLLDMRQEVEVDLSKALEKENLGEWFAGDIGPGGGNMLFAVTDNENAMNIILEVLQQQSLEKNVLIGRRVWLAKDEWFYEVIFPIKYSGSFNTM